jgi:hypothetical protein
MKEKVKKNASQRKLSCTMLFGTAEGLSWRHATENEKIKKNMKSKQRNCFQ